MGHRPVSVLGVEEVRQRFAAVIEGMTTPDAWRESPAHYDNFPTDTNSYAHLGFAVAPLTTEYAFGKESQRHSRGSVGAAVETIVGIRWTHRIRGDAQVSDLDEATLAEQVLLTTLRGSSYLYLQHWPTRVSRQLVGDGTYQMHEVLITTRHRIAIE